MISVIVPVYNCEKYLKRCLDSLNNQNTDKIEIILVDDGSTDNSGLIIDSYNFKHLKKKVIHKTNGGIISAIKAGFTYADGDYIGFVDADDYISNDMFEILNSCAEKYKTDVVMCRHFHEDKTGIFKETKQPIKEGLYDKERYNQVLSLLLPRLNSSYISPSRVNKIVKKSIIKRSIQTTNESISSGEDNYWTTRWLVDSSSLFFIDKPLYFYCLNESSVSHVFKPQLFSQYKILIAELNNYCSSIPFLNHQAKNLYNFYGFLWCIYVYKSSLSKKEKKSYILQMMKTKEFRKALKYSEKGHFLRTFIYHATVSLKMPGLLLCSLNMSKRF